MRDPWALASKLRLAPGRGLLAITSCVLGVGRRSCLLGGEDACMLRFVLSGPLVPVPSVVPHACGNHIAEQ